jgi:hypothetical protein
MMENPLFDGNYIFGSKPVIRDSIYKIG